MSDCCEKNRPTLGQIISRTKCDRCKYIFSGERERQYDLVGMKRDPMGSENVQNGVNRAEVPPPSSSMGVPSPLGCGILCHICLARWYIDCVLARHRWKIKSHQLRPHDTIHPLNIANIRNIDSLPTAPLISTNSDKTHPISIIWT